VYWGGVLRVFSRGPLLSSVFLFMGKLREKVLDISEGWSERGAKRPG